MQKRIIQAGFIGMNQDVINPQVNSKQAFEIKNFRINATANSNAVELTSEKGTKFVPMEDYTGNEMILDPQDYHIIGHCVINNHLVLFMHGQNGMYDRISNFILSNVDGNDILQEQESGSFIGNLGFDNDHKIECIPNYENEDVIKVYWIDGKNYPRVMNLKKNYGFPNVSIIDPFSFYQTVSSGDYNKISVSKDYVGGLFYSGVIQYAFSFYNRNAQETPIIYITPMNYISHVDKAEEPNKQIGCCFNVQLEINPDDHDKFEYARIYSIYRSSVNSTPVVKVVKDVKCSQMTQDEGFYKIKFTDTNQQGYDFDAYRILIDSDHIVPNAIAQKDQKLFMANYSSDTDIHSHSFTACPSSGLIEWVTDTYKRIDSDNSSKQYRHIQQTTKNSQQIKSFKKGEYYKFGVQFQDKYGKWTSPIILGNEASKNTESPVTTGSHVNLPYAKTKITVGQLMDMVSWDNEYIKVRPVVSFPSLAERKILCQGITNPTVFNITQRCNGTCFSQASWFFRPFYLNGTSEYQGMSNSDRYINGNQAHGAYVQSINFRPLFPSDNIGGELQNMYFDSGPLSLRPEKSALYITSEEALNLYQNYYFVDHSIMTFNSPDIDFDDNINNIDLDQYSVRIVGLIPFVNNYSKQEIIAESPLFLKTQKYISDSSNIDHFDQSANMSIGFVDSSWKNRKGRIVNRFSWFDDVNGIFKYKLSSSDLPMIFSSYYSPGNYWNRDKAQYVYATYPFQRQYLNNYNRGQMNFGGLTNSKVSIDDIESSKIIKKIQSNLKYSNKTIYLSEGSNQSIKDIKLFDSKENQFIKIDGKPYYGNVDQLLTTTSEFNGYVFSGDVVDFYDDSYSGRYETEGTDKCIGFIYGSGQTINGYPIIVSDWLYPAPSGTIEDIVNASKPNVFYEQFYKDEYHGYETIDGNLINIFALTPNTSSKDPIQLKYKSGKHIIFNMDKDSGGNQLLFCQIKNATGTTSYSNGTTSWVSATGNPAWENSQIEYIANNYMDLTSFSNFDFSFGSGSTQYNEMLFMCEVYKKEDDQNYVSNTDRFNNFDRDWVVCGESYDIQNDSNEYIRFLEGDTYYQRYDCLKTYPYSPDDYQSVVEIASFMVETHINLDGRYDNNRGLEDNTFVNPSNFNLINPVYGQQNNFYVYNILDEENFGTSKFPTRFTWSLNKIGGQDIDEWTRTNTAAFYDCDGDKGQITSLRRFNNQLFSFQYNGISRIKYNENVALSVKNGTPIELSNSQTVNGIEYINESIGSQNKWSCVSTQNGIFFVDNHSSEIYRLGGGEATLTPITRSCMQRWFGSRNQNGFINSASYDKNMNEVLFMYDDVEASGYEKSVVFNCDYNVFSSFYDYKGIVGNIANHSFNIVGNNVYFMREGNSYNDFYQSGTKPYWIEFVANSNIEGYSPADCIFDNVWYKADVLESVTGSTMNYGEQIHPVTGSVYDFHGTNSSGWYETFNKIEVGNDYQYACFNKTQSSTQTKYFEFIKKFRTWRVPVPRQDRARMRNSWLRIKLENTRPSTNKMVFRDAYVDSFF